MEEKTRRKETRKITQYKQTNRKDSVKTQENKFTLNNSNLNEFLDSIGNQKLQQNRK